MNFRTAAVAASVLACMVRPAAAQEYTFDLEHFLSADSVVQKLILEPWAEKIAEDSDGRIKIVVHPAMSLGGSPADLYDQVADGTIDMAWTLPGFSDDRFLSIAAFELPFTPGSSPTRNLSLMQFYGMNLTEEFSDIHPLLFHSQSPVAIHTRDQAVRAIDGFDHLRIAVATEQGARVLTALGAEPARIPIEDVATSISDGSIDGLMSSFLMAHALGLSEITPYHTDVGIYSPVFLLAMNKDAYESLPADLQAVIDANASKDTALWAGSVFDQGNADARDAMTGEGGGELYTPDLTHMDRWYSATRSVITDWISRANGAGMDGQFLVDRVMLLLSINSRS